MTAQRVHTVYVYAGVEMYPHRGNGFCDEVKFNTPVRPVGNQDMKDVVHFRVPYPAEEVEMRRVHVTIIFGSLGISYAYFAQPDRYAPTGAKVWSLDKEADIEPLSGVQLVTADDGYVWLQIDIPQVIQAGRFIGFNMWEAVSQPLPPLPSVD